MKVLPAKHYAPSGPDGSLVEIDESQVPSLAGQGQRLPIRDAGSSVDRSPLGNHERHISKDLSKGEGEHKEYINANGVPTTETTWIHHPTFDVRPQQRESDPSEDIEPRPSTQSELESDQHLSGSKNVEESKADYETRAEAAVAANAAHRRTAQGDQTNPTPHYSEFHEKPRHFQEATAAKLAARRAAGHVPGAFVE